VIKTHTMQPILPTSATFQQTRQTVQSVPSSPTFGSRKSGLQRKDVFNRCRGNNNPQGTYDPPFCESLSSSVWRGADEADNGAYGFRNGAQLDLFARADSPAAQPATSTSKSVAPASSSPASAPVVAVPIVSSSVSMGTSPVRTASATVPSSTLSAPSADSAVVSSAPSLAPSRASSSTCRQRRRSLENLTPEALERHRQRSWRRKEGKLRKRAMEERERRAEEERREEKFRSDAEGRLIRSVKKRGSVSRREV
jgi:hypothetical protein